MNKTKFDILTELEESKNKIKEYSKKFGTDKKALSDIIKEILKGENQEIQTILSLCYIEELDSKDIAEILEKEELYILYEIEYIISKIKTTLLSEGSSGKFSAKNFTGNKKNSNGIKHILDIKA